MSLLEDARAARADGSAPESAPPSAASPVEDRLSFHRRELARAEADLAQVGAAEAAAYEQLQDCVRQIGNQTRELVESAIERWTVTFTAAYETRCHQLRQQREDCRRRVEHLRRVANPDHYQPRNR